MLLASLHHQGFVDVGDYTATSDGSLDKGVQFLITTDCELQVTRSDALDLQILACVASQLKHLSGEVLQDSSRVHC